MGPGGGDAVDLRWLGHATCELRLAGVSLLTDPVLRGRMWHLRRRGAAPRVAAGSVDAVLLSHAHHDHLDLPSLRKLGRDMPVVAPPGADRIVRDAGFSDVRTLRPGERTSIGDVVINAVPAIHDGTRTGVRTRGDELAVGYIATGPDTPRVYFAGDTDLGDDLAAAVGVDLALIPVGGWWRTLGPGHLNGEAAVEALGLIRPRYAVPIHWGTFHPLGLARIVQKTLADEALAFEQRAEHAVPGTDVRILRPGQSLRVSAAERP